MEEQGKTIILSGLGITSHIIQRASYQALTKHQWFGVIPVYNALVEELETDAQATFFSLTILKTLQAIEESDNDPELFDHYWRNTKFPEYVSFENVRDGDIIIKAKLTDKLGEMQFFPVE